MKLNEKNELILQIAELLRQMIPVEDVAPTKVEDKSDIPELLTIKECAALVPDHSSCNVRSQHASNYFINVQPLLPGGKGQGEQCCDGGAVGERFG